MPSLLPNVIRPGKHVKDKLSKAGPAGYGYLAVANGFAEKGDYIFLLIRLLPLSKMRRKNNWRTGLTGNHL